MIVFLKDESRLIQTFNFASGRRLWSYVKVDAMSDVCGKRSTSGKVDAVE